MILLLIIMYLYLMMISCMYGGPKIFYSLKLRRYERSSLGQPFVVSSYISLTFAQPSRRQTMIFLELASAITMEDSLMVFRADLM